MKTSYNLKMGDFTKWIKAKRDEFLRSEEGRGKSDSQIARLIGLPPSTWSNYINSGYRPSEPTIEKIAKFFGPEVYDVLDRKRPNEYSQAEQPRDRVKDLGVTIPLLGRIAAGSAIPMPKQDFPAYGSDSVIQVVRDWLPPKADINQLFALEVEGDSMIEEGIRDGDTIIMAKSHIAENGDLVAVRIDDDDSVTLKKFFRDNGTVILQPANRDLKPVVIAAEKVHIEGKIVISIRRWK